MKLSLKEFFQKCQFPLLLVFATIPISLFLYAFLAPELLDLCWVTPAAYAAFIILAFLIPGKMRHKPAGNSPARQEPGAEPPPRSGQSG